ncbi:MAG: alpha/beta fold hydrolase, partial [Acidimicrobiia bacterium]
RMLAAPTDPGHRAVPGVSVAGEWLGDATLAEIGAAAVDLDQLSVPTLVIARPEPVREAQRWTERMTDSVEVRVRPGMPELIDVDAELAVVPESLVAEICGWVAARTRPVAGPSAPVGTPAAPAITSDTLEALDGNVTLRHRVRRLRDSGLFVVDTARVDTVPTRALITLNNGVARSIGPGGAWVDVARDMAVAGWRVIRLDLSGIGDSPARPGAVENNTYPITAAADIGEVITDLHGDGVDSFSLIGLCSGALLSFDAVLARPEIEAAISINGRFDAVFSDRRADRRRRAAGYTNRLIGTPLRKTPLLPWFEKVPYRVWAGLDRIRLVASPVEALESAVARGVRVALVFGPDEWGLRALRRRGGNRFRSVVEHPMTTLVEVSRLDHSMFDPEARTEVLGFLLPYLGAGGPAARPLAPTSA